MGGEGIERLEAAKRREDHGLIESRGEAAAQARTDGNVSWERHRSIGLSIFATPNLTTRARCLAVIGAKRWLYSTGGADRYGCHRGPDPRATASLRHHCGPAQRSFRRPGLS